MKITLKRILCMLLCGAIALPMASCETKPDFSTKPEPQPEKVAANPYASAALDLTLKICEDYYDLGNHEVKDRPDSGAACVWPFASFVEAVTETLELYPDNETLKMYLKDALTLGISKYKVKGELTTPAGTFEDITYYNAVINNHSDYYYDDNAWVCIQFLRAYELLGDEKYLTKAEELLKFFDTGIDSVLGGGIYWDKSFTSKNTCADGPVAICYLKTYQITNNEHYLKQGTALVEWMNDTLRENGLYSDNISSEGEINTWKADYNQGTPLYALSLLYSITGEEKWKELADETAEAAVKNSFRIRYNENGSFKIAYKEGNPIYKTWCVGWLMRGFKEYAKISGEKELCFTAMENVLDRNMIGKAENGYYDPYFGVSGMGSENDTEVLQPAGVASVFAVCGYYDVYIEPKLK